MFATWQNWFSTPIVFPLLIQRITSIWQPFIFHTLFLSPGDKQLEGRESWDCRGYGLTSLTVCIYNYTNAGFVCALEQGRWVGCQQRSLGKGKNLVVYVTPPASCGIVLIQRSLPGPPLGPINSSQQLRQQLEHAMRLICLNMSILVFHTSVSTNWKILQVRNKNLPLLE